MFQFISPLSFPLRICPLRFQAGCHVRKVAVHEHRSKTILDRPLRSSRDFLSWVFCFAGFPYVIAAARRALSDGRVGSFDHLSVTWHWVSPTHREISPDTSCLIAFLHNMAPHNLFSWGAVCMLKRHWFDLLYVVKDRWNQYKVWATGVRCCSQRF